MTEENAGGASPLVPGSLRLQAIVVNYNTGQRLRECISALLNQPELDCIWVIDNASIDTSLNGISDFEDSRRVKVVRNPTNIGFGPANNIALNSSGDCDWLLVNPDCVVQNGILQEFYRCRNMNPRAGVLGGLVRNPDGSEQRGCRRDLPRLGTSLLRSLGARHLFEGSRWADFDRTGEVMPSTPVRVQAVSGAFMYLRAEALYDVGLFDEGYFLHCEDLDICRRMADMGWEIWFVPGAEAVHFQGTSSRRTPLRVSWHKHRGMWRYFQKFEAPTHNLIVNLVVFLGIWLRFFATAATLWLGRVKAGSKSLR